MTDHIPKKSESSRPLAETSRTSSFPRTMTYYLLLRSSWSPAGRLPSWISLPLSECRLHQLAVFRGVSETAYIKLSNSLMESIHLSSQPDASLHIPSIAGLLVIIEYLERVSCACAYV